MDASRFDQLTRSLGIAASRRRFLWRVVAPVLGFGIADRLPDLATAKKNKKKKLKFNEFGCVNVGGKCRGNNANCCSNICQGKKPKKGKRDKSRCVGHDEQGCPPGQKEDFCGGDDLDCTTSTGDLGRCNTTTGNAGYCAGDGQCVPCKKDLDCQGQFGPLAACVLCTGCAGGTGCAFPD